MGFTVSPSSDSDHAARPPQFGLRSMFFAMTALSAVFALFVAVGPMWSAMMALVLSLVGLHVIGNALGTRLRDSKPNLLVLAERPTASVYEVAPTFESARRLQENTAIQKRWWIATGIGATVGAALGGVAIAFLVGSKLTPAGLLLGTGSSAVLGGFAFFMASSVCTVARTALREALETLDDPPANADATEPGPPGSSR